MPVRQAQKFLAEQSPCSEDGQQPVVINIRDLTARMVASLFQVTDEFPTVEKIAAAQQQEQAQFTELCVWLNAKEQAKGR